MFVCPICLPMIFRLPSTLHAVIVSFLCFWALCYSGDFFDTHSSNSSSGGIPVVFKVSPVSYTIIGISFGYFLIDAAVMAAVPEIGTTEMYVHHAVALLSLAVAAQVQCMHVYLMMVLLSELTTPFVSVAKSSRSSRSKSTNNQRQRRAMQQKMQ